mmetsp:Transcript_63991/g.152847  ORF Transcript_63991/g.152847 Transcript_63991/m.152847 type:complete len:221 (-) Transcript_63991:1283-1945(-)
MLGELGIVPPVVPVGPKDARAQRQHLDGEADQQEYTQDEDRHGVRGFPLDMAYQGGLEDASIGTAICHGFLMAHARVGAAPRDFKAPIIEGRRRGFLSGSEALEALLSIDGAIHRASDQVEGALLPEAPLGLHGEPVALAQVHSMPAESALLGTLLLVVLLSVFVHGTCQRLPRGVHCNRRLRLNVSLSVERLPAVWSRLRRLQDDDTRLRQNVVIIGSA